MRRDLLLAGLALAALLPAAAPPAQTGPKGDGGVKVSGIVYAPDPATPPAEKFMKPAAGAAVHLRDLPKGWDPKPSKEPVVLRFRKGRITPEFACVQVGQRLVVPPVADEQFNLRALSPARGDFGVTLPPGLRGFTDTFPFPDDHVWLRCAIHPTAQAQIQVVPTPGFALCDAEGRFTLPRRLPKGEHVLRAFLPGASWAEKTITLKGDEGEVRVALDLRPRKKARAPRGPGQAGTPREPPLPPGAVARLGDARYRHAGGGRWPCRRTAAGSRSLVRRR